MHAFFIETAVPFRLELAVLSMSLLWLIADLYERL